ncbi:MAG: sigma-70 family RNA polymerase sigma factor [Nocardiaceae bacterium]|nr:sigma-70 family RNA polymerase sigma factor [Nocardiaceae bacterium]
MSPVAPEPVGAGARLQPDDSAIPQLRAWLANPVFDQHARNLNRLLGDADLLLNLQLSGYAPRLWKPVAEEFARYGVGVLKAWIKDRSIFGRVKKRTGYTLKGCPDEWLQGRHAADDLATDVVVKALQYFKENVLQANKWDPARGASLSTFFIGQCLYQFPNVYRAWLNDQQSYHAIHLCDQENLEYFSRGAGDIAYDVAARDGAAQLLAEMDNDRVRRAFQMKVDGYEHAAIAVELGLANAKAVENLLRYAAHKARTSQPQARRTS